MDTPTLIEAGKMRLGLEFAPGTSEDCKRLVGAIFTPAEILGAYRAATSLFKTRDLVLVTAEGDASGFDAQPRLEYVRKLREGLGPRAPAMMKVLTIAHQSAHQIVNLPRDSDALWLVVLRQDQVPVMAVLYVTPYEIGSGAS